MFYPLNKTIYASSGNVYAIHDLLTFGLKHRLCRYSMRRFLRVPTIYVFSKNKKNVNFQLQLLFFTALNLLHCILQRHVRVMW